jgi:uncharacterized protein with gpF-like domain
MDYPISRNGYIYGARTKKGFLRMQRQGIPRPLFSLQDRLAQALERKYKSLVRKIMSDIRKHLTSKEMVVDSWEDEQEFLQKYFDDLRKQQQEQEKRNKMLNLVNELKQEWQDTTAEPENLQQELGLDITNELAKVFGANQKDYMKRLFLDADDKLNRIVQSFSIDKQEFFARNLDEIKQRYINNSMERLNGEKDLIKTKILTRINDYALGFTDDLTLDDVTKEAFDAGKHLSRLFARDQMQRFNKACTLATFKAAGVTKLKWVTCNDGRVRNKSYTDKNGVYHRAHTELQGMIFSIDNLPIEIDDYNCRCGLVPVEYSE